MATSTMGTTFYVIGGTESALTYTPVLGLITKPQLPGLPQTIDATSQEEKIATSVAGPKAAPEPTFQFKHMPHGESLTNYKFFQGLDSNDTRTKFGIAYPDGGAIEFSAVPAVVRDGTGVNALDTFTVYMQDLTDLDDLATAPAELDDPT